MAGNGNHKTDQKAIPYSRAKVTRILMILAKPRGKKPDLGPKRMSGECTDPKQGSPLIPSLC